MTRKDTTIEPTVAQIQSGKIKKPKSIRVQSSLAGGKHKQGIAIISEWLVVYGSKNVFFLSGNIVTRYNKVPLLSIDVPDRHLREVRKVANAIFDQKRFDGIELFDLIRGDRIFVVEMENKAFVTERDAVLWCILENKTALIDSINVLLLAPFQHHPASKEFRELIKETQLNSATLWANVLHLLFQVESGINAIAIFQSLLKKGLTIDELESLWLRTYEDEKIPSAIKNILTQE